MQARLPLTKCYNTGKTSRIGYPEGDWGATMLCYGYGEKGKGSIYSRYLKTLEGSAGKNERWKGEVRGAETGERNTTGRWEWVLGDVKMGRPNGYNVEAKKRYYIFGYGEGGVEGRHEMRRRMEGESSEGEDQREEEKEGKTVNRQEACAMILERRNKVGAAFVRCEKLRLQKRRLSSISVSVDTTCMTLSTSTLFAQARGRDPYLRAGAPGSS